MGRIGRLCTLLAMVTSAGCVSSSGLIPYRGVQQNWPVSAGAIAEEIEGIPVYQGYPEKPYMVLGSLQVTGEQWQVGFIHEGKNQMMRRVLKSAISEAKKAGAHAVIYDGQSSFLSHVSVRDRGANIDVLPMAGSTASVIVIRFKE